MILLHVGALLVLNFSSGHIGVVKVFWLQMQKSNFLNIAFFQDANVQLLVGGHNK